MLDGADATRRAIGAADIIRMLPGAGRRPSCGFSGQILRQASLPPDLPLIRRSVSRTKAMTTTVLSKREIRERSSQLRALMRKWDPIGVMSDPDWPATSMIASWVLC